MPLYIYQAAYTPESVTAQIREPADRFEAVRPAFEAMGGKIVAGRLPVRRVRHARSDPGTR
jgi:hypothetical protein